jgi:thiol:disulfide interchange protein
MKLPLATFCALAFALLVAAARGQSAPASQPATAPTTRPAVYDEHADAHQDLAAALAKAQRENQRVLLIFGGNWCGWCVRLHTLLEKNADIARQLAREYQVVRIDVGRFDKQMDIAEKYELDLRKAGVPYLAILDAAGKVVLRQPTGELEAGQGHDAGKVLGLLRANQAPPLDAERVLADAQARAAAAQQRVFVRLGAPWCVWCHRLDDFLAQPAVAELLARDYVLVKIDQERMTGGANLARRLRGGTGGIPWFAILDAEGHALATSDAEKGTIGYPCEPAEIDHFLKMLDKTRRQLEPKDLQALRGRLEEAAKKINAERQAGAAH